MNKFLFFAFAFRCAWFEAETGRCLSLSSCIVKEILDPVLVKKISDTELILPRQALSVGPRLQTRSHSSGHRVQLRANL